MNVKKFNSVDFIIVDVTNESIFNYLSKIRANDGVVLGYSMHSNIAYYSERYKKWITVKACSTSDGATWARDIDSFGWIFHDELCATGVFNDGTKCNNWQASSVLSDIMQLEERSILARLWFIGTWFGGGGKARDNGMW